jgi:catechol 2,3-dioxygenase-like lactoylglutathione lyase family enzyme
VRKLRPSCFAACLALLALPVVAQELATPVARIDHVVVGVADLDAAIEAFERATGVRPVYGGKHPGGTHNALLSLGDGVYLEILALQPGVDVPEYAGLRTLLRPTPMLWAVSGGDLEALRRPLVAASFKLSEPHAGSRVTPAGATLAWETFGIDGEGIAGAPFFIVWSADTPHPATTSPAGCTLAALTVITPALEPLERLRTALGLEFGLATGEPPALTLELACPAGKLVY